MVANKFGIKKSAALIVALLASKGAMAEDGTTSTPFGGPVIDPSFAESWANGVWRKCPLVLNMSTNPIIELLSSKDFQADGIFDFDGNGNRDATGWVGKSAGFLVRDLNGDGLINDGSEMFGEDTVPAENQNPYTSGFQALASFDSNLDGKIDEADPVFQDLKIWRDLNSDGVSQAGELRDISEIGISEVKIKNSSLLQRKVFVNANQLSAVSTFKMNGKSHLIYDVKFFGELR